MKKNDTFEDLKIWQTGVTLVHDTYFILKECIDWSFKDQIQRAVVSIPSNIAEGHERQTNKEFIYFLYVAKGSCGEYRTQLRIAADLGYISNADYINLQNRAITLSAMIQSFINFRKEMKKVPQT